MNFLRRLGIFSVGLSIGLIILAFFFKGKGVEICYFPNCRVLKDIRNKPVSVSEQQVQEKYTIEVLKPIFWNGSVHFGNSDTKRKPCRMYEIEGTTSQNEQVILLVENCPKEAVIVSVRKK